MRILKSVLVALLLLPGRGIQAQSTPGGTDTQSRLVAGDALRIEVWREKDLSGEFIVDEQGIVTLPLLGRIDVSSIPLAGLRDKLITAYSAELRNPSVTITPLRRIYVLGEVMKPGLYPVDPTITLGGAIALAGGANPTGDLHRIRIIRDGKILFQRTLNAHEWGHNFGRPHSACGVPDPDPSYPVPSGHTDSWGYNTAELKTYSPTLYYDIMSYCTPKWVAGYTVKQMMNFVGPAAAAAPAEAATSTLIVWGHIGAEGAVVLEPAFEVNTLPKRPEGHGPFAIEGRDASGSVMFSDRFEGVEVGDGAPGERHFAFAIPMSHENAARLRKIQIVRAATRAPLGAKSAQATIDAVAEAEPAESVQAVSGGMEVKWNSRTYPMVMVRDALTGEVISFARGGDARLRSRGGRAVDLIFSDGVHSRTKRVNPL